MKIESSAFNPGDYIPKKYTCQGEDISPPLKIYQVPKEAKSLVLIMEDPDAPRGTFLHWMVWNIPPDIGEISEGGEIPGAVEGINDFGSKGYGGPCPPFGEHRYFFKVYALSEILDLPYSTSKEELFNYIRGKVLDTAELMGRFKKEE